MTNQKNNIRYRTVATTRKNGRETEMAYGGRHEKEDVR